MNALRGNTLKGSTLTGPETEAGTELAGQFCSVRQQTETLCEPLTPEDMMVQSCLEASPAKWHLAHTTWFFETFLLSEFLPGYRPFHPDFIWLFNSYYNTVSDQPLKKLRGSFSRPSLEEILGYRRHVEEAMTRLIEGGVTEESGGASCWVCTTSSSTRSFWLMTSRTHSGRIRCIRRIEPGNCRGRLPAW